MSSEKFRTFDKLLEHMTRIMCNQVTLPHGVRYIFGLDGKNVESVEELLHGSNYVCSSNSTFKRMDYSKIAQEQENHWNKMKRETCYLGKKYLLWKKIILIQNHLLKSPNMICKFFLRYIWKIWSSRFQRHDSPKKVLRQNNNARLWNFKT